MCSLYNGTKVPVLLITNRRTFKHPPPPPWLIALHPLSAHPFSQNFKQVRGCLFEKYGRWISLLENDNIKVSTHNFPLSEKGRCWYQQSYPSHEVTLKRSLLPGIMLSLLRGKCRHLLESPNDTCFLQRYPSYFLFALNVLHVFGSVGWVNKKGSQKIQASLALKVQCSIPVPQNQFHSAWKQQEGL